MVEANFVLWVCIEYATPSILSLHNKQMQILMYIFHLRYASVYSLNKLAFLPSESLESAFSAVAINFSSRNISGSWAWGGRKFRTLSNCSCFPRIWKKKKNIEIIKDVNLLANIFTKYVPICIAWWQNERYDHESRNLSEFVNACGLFVNINVNLRVCFTKVLWN